MTCWIVYVKMNFRSNRGDIIRRRRKILFQYCFQKICIYCDFPTTSAVVPVRIASPLFRIRRLHHRALVFEYAKYFASQYCAEMLEKWIIAVKTAIHILLADFIESHPLNPEILKYDENMKNFETTGRRMKQEAKDEKMDGLILKRESRSSSKQKDTNVNNEKHAPSYADLQAQVSLLQEEKKNHTEFMKKSWRAIACTVENTDDLLLGTAIIPDATIAESYNECNDHLIEIYEMYENLYGENPRRNINNFLYFNITRRK